MRNHNSRDVSKIQKEKSSPWLQTQVFCIPCICNCITIPWQPQDRNSPLAILAKSAMRLFPSLSWAQGLQIWILRIQQDRVMIQELLQKTIGIRSWLWKLRIQGVLEPRRHQINGFVRVQVGSKESRTWSTLEEEFD